MVFHYSDIQISGFGFFRIFPLFKRNIDPSLTKFGMNDLQDGTEDFHYSDIRISGFGFFGCFRIVSLYGHNIGSIGKNRLQCGTELRISTKRISEYPVSDYFGYFYFTATILT